MQTTPIILSNFHDYYLTPPIAQGKLNKHFAYMMASAYCVSHRINSSTEANRIYREIWDKVEKYAVSPDQIHTRQYNFLPENIYDYLLEHSIETKSMAVVTDDASLATKMADATVSRSKKLKRSIVKTNTNSPSLSSRFSQTHNNLLQQPTGLTVDQRMFLYEASIIKILQQAYVVPESLPDSIIHTTCLGYISPSPLQTYLSRKNWLHTQILHAYHMGCYAAVPTVHLAVGLVSASYNSLAKPIKVDAFHFEMPSLHLNAMDTSPGHIVNMTLFGDGFIKYSITAEQEFKRQKIPGLKVLAIDTVLIKNALADMKLTLSPFQFDVFISKNVPLLIGKNIHAFMKRLCKQINLDFDKVKNDIQYAIHPGGPKILNYIEQVLNLPDDKMRFSRNIFYNLGNMVSATLPHVWKDMINSDQINPGEKIISVAFGPGLTVTGLILEKV